MRCVICGNYSDGPLCGGCRPKADESLCYRVAYFYPKQSNNFLWKQIADEMGNPYKFNKFSLDIADIIGGSRREFIKIKCMSMFFPDIGVPKDYRRYVLLNYETIINNTDISSEEKNLVTALAVDVLVHQRDWDKAYKLLENVRLDKMYLDPYLIGADFYIKITEYDVASAILNRAKGIFTDLYEIERIDKVLDECDKRNTGIKKAWHPVTSVEMEEFRRFLDKLGIEYKKPYKSGGGKRKILQKDFKPLTYYSEGLPERYVAIWITTEFHIKVRDAVEISAIRVDKGKRINVFHSFIKPLNRHEKCNHVDIRDLEDAEHIRDVFPRFLEFLGDDVIAISDVGEQSKQLSRSARYSMMDHIDNQIFDVVSYGEDISEEIEMHTRQSLLEKYGLEEGNTGMEKVNITVDMIEKMRG